MRKIRNMYVTKEPLAKKIVNLLCSQKVFTSVLIHKYVSSIRNSIGNSAFVYLFRFSK